MKLGFQLSRKFLLVMTVVACFIHTSKGTPKVIDAHGKGVSRNEQSGIAFANFKAHEFSYLNITSLTTDNLLNGRECGLACVNKPSCFSFNLAAFYDITEKILCELLPSDKYNNSDKFVTSQLFHHFSIRSPCMSWPCLHNGTCVSLYKKNSYACLCMQGYTGTNCETDIDECVSGAHDCHSSASCTNTVGSYTCSCNHPYTGDGKICLPPECQNYQSLTGADRKTTYYTHSTCDDTLGPDWFRFQGAAGTRMPTSCVPVNSCDTSAPGWLNGAHPTLADGRVTRQVCFTWFNDCCKWSTNIQVRNCGSFYVYFLSGTPDNNHCDLRYCGTD